MRRVLFLVLAILFSASSQANAQATRPPTEAVGAFFSKSGQRPFEWVAKAEELDATFARLVPRPDQTALLIFSQGSSAGGGLFDPCVPTSVPGWLLPVVQSGLKDGVDLVVFHVCQREGGGNAFTYGIRRRVEVEGFVNRFIALGISPSRLFLGGQSWGSRISILVASKNPDRVAGVLAFALGAYEVRSQSGPAVGKSIDQELERYAVPTLVYGVEGDTVTPPDRVLPITRFPSIEYRVVANTERPGADLCGRHPHFFYQSSCFGSLGEARYSIEFLRRTLDADPAVRPVALLSPAPPPKRLLTEMEQKKQEYDGEWQVNFDFRGCENLPRHALRVSAGTATGILSHSGSGPVSVNGRIDAIGGVALRLLGAGVTGAMTGRLRAQEGSGEAKITVEPRSECAGTWRADRVKPNP
jgi:hypothetical protein